MTSDCKYYYINNYVDRKNLSVEQLMETRKPHNE